MQARAWTAFLRRIPPEQHDSLMLMTTIGMEISIQNVVCMEEEHLVLRGRLAGTTDMGRVFIIPYDQVNYLGFQREMNDTQIREIFGESCLLPTHPSAEEAARQAQADGALPSSESSVSPADSSAQPDESGSPEARLPIPAKAALLERLRARSRAAAQASPPPPT